jgi:hypothetical protein
MLELSDAHLATLERLRVHGFEIVGFPMYPSHVGVRKGDCAALLAPEGQAGFRLFADPAWMISGQLSVRIFRDGREWFVWKKQRLDASPERLAELAGFTAGLRELLALSVP